MSLGEFFGYVASVLVFATFYMKTMVPLRLVAIASNVAFIIYAVWGGLTPILILHVLLLPLNTIRLLQLRNLSRQVERAARESFSPQALLPLMRQREIHANETLFSANDPASELFYVLEGTLFLPELQQEIGPGTFLGEFALFSDAGRRTASAIARTDCRLMSLSRNAVFAALVQDPRLGIHLLRLVTARFLQNSGQDQRTPPVVALPPGADAAKPVVARVSRPGVRAAVRIAVLASVALVVALAYHPIYTMLYRDAVVTTWLNVVAAPIAGTIEGFDLKPGERVAASGEVGRVVNYSVDRSGVIQAEAAARLAAVRLAELSAYESRIAATASEWQERKSHYADGFRRDLDLKIEEFGRRIVLLQERVEFADAAAKRKQTLRRAGNTSQADEEAAISSHRELLATLTDATMDLQRLRHRRELAGRGVYLQEDGKEPEWSWRSLDELRLEMHRTARAARETQQEVGTLQATLENERKNLGAATDAVFRVPAGMTIWTTSASNGISVTRGQKLFTWIDCSRLLVDVPVIDTLAVLVEHGSRAEVSLEGEDEVRPASVVLSRGSSSRLDKNELASIAEWSKSSAQILVELKTPASIAGCPIGRRAFVRFPDLTLAKFLRAYLPM
jgi:CRP/FNR family cyclic AMP-dependent transcriptional regulator